MTYQITPIANYLCQCGENPLWDDRRKLVLWEDISLGRIFQYDPATRQHRTIYEGGTVGGFTLQEDGALLLFGENRICLLTPSAEGTARETVCAQGIDDGMTRFNDVIADPAGRVFAGTMGKTNDSGGLIRVGLDGKTRVLFRGTGCSNGMGFSRDGRTFYWTDSTARKIFQFDYDLAGGELSNRRLFYAAPGEGTPDGMTVDSQGFIWSARWDGHCLCRHDPSGKLLEQIAFPVAKVSSLIFGGADLCDVYVTTAGGQAQKSKVGVQASAPATLPPGQAPCDGTLYHFRAPVAGVMEFRSRVRF